MKTVTSIVSNKLRTTLESKIPPINLAEHRHDTHTVRVLSGRNARVSTDQLCAIRCTSVAVLIGDTMRRASKDTVLE